MKALLVRAAMMRNGRVSRQRRILSPSLSLAHVAALFPPDWDLSLVDDEVQEIPFDAPVDLVGITFYGPAAYRAFDIARRFRERGVPVVFGGPSASLIPEINRPHCDSMVIGDGEDTIPRLLDDVARGVLAPEYRADGHGSLAGLPTPRYDLLDPSQYLGFYPIQTARGCVFRCAFCSIPRVHGFVERYRPIDEVIRDAEAAIRASGARRLFIVDDNINMKPARAVELFRALAPLRVEWISFATTLIAKQPEVLRLAAESGCRLLLIGFESMSAGTLAGANKRHNHPEEYARVVRTVQDHGIHVNGAFVVGLDGEAAPGAFDDVRDFVNAKGMSLPTYNLVTPAPGTPFYDSLHAAGRVLDRDMAHYDGEHVLVRPAGMSAAELDRGFRRLRRETYSIPAILRRVVFRKPVGGWSRWRVQVRMLMINLAKRAQMRRVDRERPTIPLDGHRASTCGTVQRP